MNINNKGVYVLNLHNITWPKKKAYHGTKQSFENTQASDENEKKYLS